MEVQSAVSAGSRSNWLAESAKKEAAEQQVPG
jgi:hypothetical protein